MEDFKQQTIRIILVGKSGSGKSSVGNLILGQKVFKVSRFSGTTQCQQEQRILDDGTKLIVVDTPGYGSIKLSDEETKAEIHRGMKMLKPGPAVIIYTSSLSERVTGEDIKHLEEFTVQIGEHLKDGVLPVFTGMDFLFDDDSTLEEQCGTLPTQYQEFIRDCGSGLIAVISKKYNISVYSTKILDAVKQLKGLDLDVFSKKPFVINMQDDARLEMETEPAPKVVRQNEPSRDDLYMETDQPNDNGRRHPISHPLQKHSESPALLENSCTSSGMLNTPTLQHNKIRVLLVGKCGSGKSSVGNLILGQKGFKVSKFRGTTQCQQEQRTLDDGTELIVVDTPGYQNAYLTEEEAKNEIMKGLELMAPLKDIIFRVHSVSEPISINDLEALEKVQVMVIPIFTGKDSLDDDGIDPDEYLKKLPQEFRQEISESGRGLICVNSKKSDPAISQQILDVIKHLGEKDNRVPKRRRFHEELASVNIDKDFIVVEKTDNGIVMSDEVDKGVSTLVKIDKFEDENQQEPRNGCVILLGKSGIGKSSLGNVLLGEKKFKTSMMEDRGTKQCQLEVKNSLTLVDTPGFFSSLRSDVASANNIIDTLTQNRLRIHAFILVFSVDDRFAGDEQKILDLVIKLFGKEVMNLMIVVFTGKDSLDDDEDEDKEFQIPGWLPKNIPYFTISCKQTSKADVDKIWEEIFNVRYKKGVVINYLNGKVLDEIRKSEEKRRLENTPDPEAYRKAVYSGMGLSLTPAVTKMKHESGLDMGTESATRVENNTSYGGSVKRMIKNVFNIFKK